MQYKVTIKIESNSEDEVKRIGSLIQQVVTSTQNADMISLLSKVVKNPKLVKTALKFA